MQYRLCTQFVCSDVVDVRVIRTFKSLASILCLILFAAGVALVAFGARQPNESSASYPGYPLSYLARMSGDTNYFADADTAGACPALASPSVTGQGLAKHSDNTCDTGDTRNIYYMGSWNMSE